MNVPDAVIRVLQDHPEGLSAKEITNEIITRQLYRFASKAPQTIVERAIRRHCIGVEKNYSCRDRYFSSSKNSSTGGTVFKLSVSSEEIASHIHRFSFPRHHVERINAVQQSSAGHAMKMDAQNQTIRKLLEQYCFTVPDYQRSYSWKSEQINEFMEDLYNIVHGEQAEVHHFLGAMTMAKSEINKNAMDLIDGQQRMTTIFIILFVILEEYHSDRFSSQASNRAKELYRKLAYLNDDAEFVASRLVLGKFNADFFEDFIVKGYLYSEENCDAYYTKHGEHLQINRPVPVLLALFCSPQLQISSAFSISN